MSIKSKPTHLNSWQMCSVLLKIRNFKKLELVLKVSVLKLQTAASQISQELFCFTRCVSIEIHLFPRLCLFQFVTFAFFVASNKDLETNIFEPLLLALLGCKLDSICVTLLLDYNIQ